MKYQGPLHRTRTDVIATGCIVVLSILAVLGVVLSAPAREAHIQVADHSPSLIDAPVSTPTSFSQVWQEEASTQLTRSVLAEPGLTVIANADNRSVHAVDSEGNTVWSYSRQQPICALSAAWKTVIITFRGHGNSGCGDVVSLDSATGQYRHTRSAPAPESVYPVTSNDRVGTVGQMNGQGRVELWRSDLVRTIEYGHVDAPQEPDSQPYPECSPTSALTRKEELAIVETCGDQTWLRLMDTSPEDSRKPAVKNSAELSAGSKLVAIGHHRAAVYNPDSIDVYDSSAHKISSTPITPAALVDPNEAAVIQDLPHHMTWFDGNALHLFIPSTLHLAHSFDDALGTGVAVAGRLLYPTARGIAVANWDTGEVEKTITVPGDVLAHANPDQPVALSVVNDQIVMECAVQDGTRKALGLSMRV